MKIAETGNKYGKLTVLAEEGRNKHGNTTWLCQCECGKKSVISGVSLRSGNSTTCGCGRIKHGHRPKTGVSATYYSWRAMISRCTNPNTSNYPDYGGRGITVYPEWASSFEPFLKSMGERPPGTYLERINNAKGYTPANCRWATAKEQARNRRSSRRITYAGETLTLVEWSERTGINTTTLGERLKRGWSVEQALTKKVIKS